MTSRQQASMTLEECITFLAPFIPIIARRNIISRKWLEAMNNGKTPYEALEETILIKPVSKMWLPEEIVTPILEEFAPKESQEQPVEEPVEETVEEPVEEQQETFNVEVTEEEEDVEEEDVEDTTDLAFDNATETLRNTTTKDSSIKVDYFHMPKSQRTELINKSLENLVIEHPDPDFKRILTAAPATIVRRFMFMKYWTYLRSEHSMTDDNKDFFMMYKWDLSPEQNKELMRLEKEALVKMYATESPEELIQERIEYMRAHQYFLTVPKIDTPLCQTRVVRSSVFDFDEVVKMRIHQDYKWTIPEAINEVITPQMISIHPFFDFDFDFENGTSDYEKCLKIDSVFKWLSDLIPIFGNYCAGGYTKNSHIAKRYFPKSYRPYCEKGGHELSLHVVFYERAMLITDLYELFRVKDNKKLYTQNMIDEIDASVYELTKRRVFRHLLSPKLNLMEKKKAEYQYQRDDRMYNGVFLKGYEASTLQDSLLTLSGNEKPVNTSDLLSFFGYDHNKPLGKTTTHVPTTPKQRVNKEKVTSNKEKRRLEYTEEDGKAVEISYKESVVKVVLPIEIMEELLSMIPCLRYSQFMYSSDSELFKAVTAFVVNSPYSYEDTLRLMTQWYHSIEHQNAPGEMDKLVQRDYYKEGVHRQHNNSYFHCFHDYALSLVSLVENIEKDCCRKYNIPFEIYEFYKTDLQAKLDEANKKGGHANRYKKRLEKAANEITELHPLNTLIEKNSTQNEYADLLPTTSDTTQESTAVDDIYDWIPEVTQFIDPVNPSKNKLDESIRFKFHTTMFRLHQQMDEDIEKAKDTRKHLMDIKNEFAKRVMAINVPGKDGYEGWRYNNFHDKAGKGIVTITFDQGKPLKDTNTKILSDYYKKVIKSEDLLYTSLRELSELSLEQKLAPLKSVDSKDPRTISAKRFIEAIKKTFKREVDAKCYFDFLRRKLENPKKKLTTNLICYGASGVFKTGLINVVGTFIPTKFLSMDDVTSKFNDYLLGKSICVIEEIAANEDNASQKTEAIKRLLNHTVNIQVKHGASFDAEVNTNMVLNCNCSNIGGLLSYRETKDMRRRFKVLPRIEPENWNEEFEWCVEFIEDHENWKNIAYVILQQDYMTKEDELLLSNAQIEEYKRFKTVEGNKGLLSYDMIKGCLSNTADKYMKNKNMRKNAITLSLKALNEALVDTKRYNVGKGTEREFLIANGVIQVKSKINYVIDIAKLFFIYIDITDLSDIENLLIKLKKDYPECVNSEYYKQELADFFETTGLKELGENVVPNPNKMKFQHFERKSGC